MITNSLWPSLIIITIPNKAKQKMNIDSIYSERNQDRGFPYSNTNKQNSKISRMKSEKLLKGHLNPQKLTIEQIQKQILKQISITEDTMRSFEDNMNSLTGLKSWNHSDDQFYDSKSNNSSVNISKLRNLEQSIRRKDQTIKQIEEDIKMLKNGTYYDSKQKSEENNFEKFINEIKDQRENMVKTQKLLANKMKEVLNKKQVIKNIEGKYQEKCRKEGIQFLSFQAFKQAEIRKKKEAKKSEKYRKVNQKRMGSSIKQYPNSGSKQSANQITASIHGTDSKRMKDLLNRKNVAETALKTAKKKHILELNDLYGKRDFLLDENQDLEEKLIMKENQLKMAEQKFSESRGSISTKKIAERRYKTERNL